ncbi:hypothetical protein HYPSUDRAFT_170535 [Hypholoma sublateritium FD-334 SS-4]|uniref:Uncharacterized protein n=1 Tax=Hypholoma sublateritium (strain FD-334 SS-4) TaxID=945553 RepID=A0A0D2NEI7_HYPSF|nr:hypothetical protein HYPSUDRAFT_170535 [Hypholoma sublateritium FD-334 SS-4]
MKSHWVDNLKFVKGLESLGAELETMQRDKAPDGHCYREYVTVANPSCRPGSYYSREPHYVWATSGTIEISGWPFPILLHQGPLGLQLHFEQTAEAH